MSQVMPIVFYGEVYCWCVSKASGVSGWQFQYLRLRELLHLIRQTRALQEIRLLLSGFMEWRRGRHWDRRRRR